MFENNVSDAEFKLVRRKISLSEDKNFHSFNLEKPYKNVQERQECSFCSEMFSDSYLLKKHMEIHLRLRSFMCNVCKKGFSTKGNLKNHYRIHTGEKPYKCNACGRTSNHLSNLKKHIITQHGPDALNSLLQ